MKDLQKFVAECETELKSIGIKQGKVSKWVINTTATTWYGQCKKLADGTFQISIVQALLYDDASDQALKNTIMHELLHTVEGSMKHTGRWKLNAESVNKRLPQYKISRLNSYKPSEAATKTYKYGVRCTVCGKVYYRNKMSNLIKQPERYFCGICRGRLTRIDV